MDSQQIVKLNFAVYLRCFGLEFQYSADFLLFTERLTLSNNIEELSKTRISAKIQHKLSKNIAKIQQNLSRTSARSQQILSRGESLQDSQQILSKILNRFSAELSAESQQSFKKGTLLMTFDMTGRLTLSRLTPSKLLSRPVKILGPTLPGFISANAMFSFRFLVLN